MTEFKWLEKYSGETTDELIAYETEYRKDSLVVAFASALGQKANRLGKNGLTEEEVTVLAVEALELEVNNGGYLQFFLYAREYIPVIVESLRLIGCDEAAALTQSAINHLRFESDHDLQDQRLSECDALYFKTVGDLAPQLFEFIKTNRDRISL
jgi:hypothetical protein